MKLLILDSTLVKLKSPGKSTIYSPATSRRDGKIPHEIVGYTKSRHVFEFYYPGYCEGIAQLGGRILMRLRPRSSMVKVTVEGRRRLCIWQRDAGILCRRDNSSRGVEEEESSWIGSLV